MGQNGIFRTLFLPGRYMFLFLLVLELGVATLFAQTNNYIFEGDVKVTDTPPGWNNANTVSSGMHSIAARGDTVYAVWNDGRNNGDFIAHIYFAKSTDAGRSFGPNVQVDDNNTAYTGCDHASLAVDKNGVIYVVWEDSRRWDLDIRFAKSTDGGRTFLPSVRVDDVNDRTVKQEFPAIAVDNDSIVYVAWNDYRDTLISIYSARSPDGGFTFDKNVKVNNARAHAMDVSVGANDSGGVYVA